MNEEAYKEALRAAGEIIRAAKAEIEALKSASCSREAARRRVGITPPVYDDVYREAVLKMEEE